MSKSRGNVVDPWEVIDRHGADAFRWYYFTAQQPWAGYRFSAETVGESVRQFMLDALEHVRVLGPVRERRGPRHGGPRAELARRRTGAELMASSIGGRCRGSRARCGR